MSLQEKIEKAWDNRELLKEEEYQNAVREVVAKLDAGELRTAEPTENGWLHRFSHPKTYAYKNLQTTQN